jgi:hypothetical protein
MKKLALFVSSYTRFDPNSAIGDTVEVSESDVLRLTFTAKEGVSAARPHQSFILVEDTVRKLDLALPIPIKSSGKAKLDFVAIFFTCLTTGPSRPPYSITIGRYTKIDSDSRIIWQLYTSEAAFCNNTAHTKRLFRIAVRTS